MVRGLSLVKDIIYQQHTKVNDTCNARKYRVNMRSNIIFDTFLSTYGRNFEEKWLRLSLVGILRTPLMGMLKRLLKGGPIIKEEEAVPKMPNQVSKRALFCGPHDDVWRSAINSFLIFFLIRQKNKIINTLFRVYGLKMLLKSFSLVKKRERERYIHVFVTKTHTSVRL